MKRLKTKNNQPAPQWVFFNANSLFFLVAILSIKMSFEATLFTQNYPEDPSGET